jgi:hypothetical protein
MSSPCGRELSKIPVRLKYSIFIGTEGDVWPGLPIGATGDFQMSSNPTYSVELGIRHKKETAVGTSGSMPLRNLSQL